MKLAQWLDGHNVKRKDFAAKIGRSAAYITDLCQGTCWPSRDVAAAIMAETNGDVTPIDFLEGA